MYSADDEDVDSRHDDSEEKVITRASLLSAQTNDLRKVADMLGIKQKQARTLLIHERWDCKRLCENLAEQGKEVLFFGKQVYHQRYLQLRTHEIPDICHALLHVRPVRRCVTRRLYYYGLRTQLLS